MLPNIDPSLYARFKVEGYRKKEYAHRPVQSVSEIVQLGYLDVNRTIRGVETQQSHLFKTAVILAIGELLKNPPQNQQEFDSFHDVCCQNCIQAGTAGKARIHYGQAQKLLNMSLKYLYNEFAAFHGKHNQFGFPENNIEGLFHLPIDSQIRDYLVLHCNFLSPTSLPWSQWNYQHYMNFQNQLRGRLSADYRALEIDYMLWNTKGASVGNAITSRRLA
jgi:hypothetical protein